MPKLADLSKTEAVHVSLPLRFVGQHCLKMFIGGLLSIVLHAPIVVAAEASRPSQQDPTAADEPPEKAAARPGSQRVSAPSANGHEVLFLALFDCSWEHAKRGPTGPTTIRMLYERLRSAANFNMHAGYVKTDCARDNWFMSRDHGQAVFDRQLEDMYAQLVARAVFWHAAYPDARISVASLGGSWGGAQAAGFSRVIHERGIQKPGSLALTKGNNVDSRQLLAEPGQVKQVVAMLDPVGTMVDLPNSVLSGIQLVARDEKREDFRSIPIIPVEESGHGSFMRATLPGSHSDVCGGYKVNGLAIRTANILIGFINRLSDKPLIKEFEVPSDPKFDAIHKSEQEEI